MRRSLVWAFCASVGAHVLLFGWLALGSSERMGEGASVFSVISLELYSPGDGISSGGDADSVNSVQGHESIINPTSLMSSSISPNTTENEADPDRLQEKAQTQIPETTRKVRPVAKPAPSASPLKEIGRETPTPRRQPEKTASVDDSAGSGEKEASGSNNGARGRHPGMQGQGAGAGGRGQFDGNAADVLGLGSQGGPRIIRLVKPEHPVDYRGEKPEGTVRLLLHLSSDGKVERIVVLQSAGELLDTAAQKAVRRSRFHPATVNGINVSCKTVISFTFKLRPSGN